MLVNKSFNLNYFLESDLIAFDSFFTNLLINELGSFLLIPCQIDKVIDDFSSGYLHKLCFEYLLGQRIDFTRIQMLPNLLEYLPDVLWHLLLSNILWQLI